MKNKQYNIKNCCGHGYYYSFFHDYVGYGPLCLNSDVYIKSDVYGTYVVHQYQINKYNQFITVYEFSNNNYILIFLKCVS